MKTFRVLYEEAEIESLKALISDPDPQRVKEYGGTAYVDMLKKRLEKAQKAAAIHDHLKKSPLSSENEEIEEIEKDQFFDKSNDYGFSYKGYQLEIEEDEEPGERNFYYGKLFNPKGERVKLPKRDVGGGNEDFVNTMGGIEVLKLQSYIDSLIPAAEDAEDRCKRKADSVYGKKTSAYKSGSIVRCRKGKIWKKK